MGQKELITKTLFLSQSYDHGNSVRQACNMENTERICFQVHKAAMKLRRPTIFKSSDALHVFVVTGHGSLDNSNHLSQCFIIY